MENKLVSLSHVPKKEMIADVLTKALTRVQHKNCVRGLGLATHKDVCLEGVCYQDNSKTHLVAKYLILHMYNSYSSLLISISYFLYYTHLSYILVVLYLCIVNYSLKCII